jgi:RNA polymerase-binding transcription factor DksA
MRSQRDKLLKLREGLTESMAVVTKRSPLGPGEASRVGIHPADAGSDAYDRDFALSLLSREQDALYEINQALRRIELGTYGTCEMSGNLIPRARLEAIPFARFTVECQSKLERQKKVLDLSRRITSPFDILDTEEELGEGKLNRSEERYLEFQGGKGEAT